MQILSYLDRIDNIYEAKTNLDYKPAKNNRKEGIYDPAINVGLISISTIEIENIYNILMEDYPTMLLSISKNKKYNNIIYNTFNLEAQFNGINRQIMQPENIYNYGQLIGPITIYYKLNHDINKEIMKIILSFNSDNLSWSISDEANSHINSKKYRINSVETGGKIIITIKPGNKKYVYLNMWKNDVFSNPQLINYAFKYINIESEAQFNDYKIYNNDGTIQYKEEQNNDKVTITCIFNRIDVTDNQANVTYYLKIADAKDYIKNESFSTISVTETPFYTKYKRNPQYTDNKITLSATGDFKYWCYLQIIARIQQNNNVEFVAYDGVKIQRDNPN